MIKSPSGSLCPYYYMGGELHPLKYGGYHSDKAGLIAVMQAEEQFILQSAGQHNRRIWVDLYETMLDGESAAALASHIAAIQSKILRLCFVGCSYFGKRKLERQLRLKSIELMEKARFFSDPEKAKQWLIGCGEQ